MLKALPQTLKGDPGQEPGLEFPAQLTRLRGPLGLGPFLSWELYLQSLGQEMLQISDCLCPRFWHIGLDFAGVL